MFAGRDPVTGKVRHLSHRVHGGIRAARTARAELLTQVAEEKEKTRSSAESFGQLLDDWLALGIRNGRSPNTIAGYRKKIESTIRPALGDVPLSEITAARIDAFYDQLLAEGVTPQTIIHYHRVISAALTQARKWKRVPTNEARDASPPSVRHKPMVVPPPEKVRALIDLAANSKAPHWAAVITFAAMTGLRRGELCGLRWSDVDWSHHVIQVERSIWQTNEGWGVKEPKTHQKRRLVLGEQTMAVLGVRLRQVEANAAVAEIPLSPDAYVFSPDLDGTTPPLPGALTLAFRRFTKKMEERTGEPWPYRLHDLRHYTATELFRAGHHARTVADRLGHADPALTLRVYTHDTQDQALAAARSLEAGLGTVPALSR
ncbi:MAG: tyrosine-type recombinase/integrase [Acidimicrobiales bacterium]